MSRPSGSLLAVPPKWAKVHHSRQDYSKYGSLLFKKKNPLGKVEDIANACKLIRRAFIKYFEQYTLLSPFDVFTFNLLWVIFFSAEVISHVYIFPFYINYTLHPYPSYLPLMLHLTIFFHFATWTVSIIFNGHVILY